MNPLYAWLLAGAILFVWVLLASIVTRWVMRQPSGAEIEWDMGLAFLAWIFPPAAILIVLAIVTARKVIA